MGSSSASRTVRRALLTAAVAAVFAAAAAAASAADRYVALGDSFSSGVGTGSYTLDSGCKRSVYAYPYLLEQQRGWSDFAFVACSGATTTDVINTQLGSVTSTTTVVTLTIGGNDIGFANLIYQCTLSDCSAALDATRASLSTTLGPRLDDVYRRIKGAAPAAKVVVLGYPRMFSSSGCFGTLGISSTERSKANQLADALDQLTAARALADGVTYKSAITAFGGHAVCSSTAWLNGLNLFNTGESYHPNRSGHSSGYLPLAQAAIG